MKKYVLDHSSATVSLTLTDDDRFICKTQGKGAIDKPKVIDIPLSDLRNFCRVETTNPQNLRGFRSEGDFSYNSEFIFTYSKNGKTKTKRIFINSNDEDFERLLNALTKNRPDASLQHLPKEEALKKMGVMSAKKAVRIFLWLLIGIPVLIALIYSVANLFSQ
ncbi:MAG: hypothetical protein WCY16_06955 [Weeksellaceae bacterium]